MTNDEILENWRDAGLICGNAYADEMLKLSALKTIEDELEETTDKEARQRLIEIARGILTGPGARAIGVAGLAGAGGYAVGKKKERRELTGQIQEAAPQIFRAGFEQGARQGFVEGARAGYIHARREIGVE